MGAFLGISLWVALATVVPGLITIAVVCCAFIIADVDLSFSAQTPALLQSDWVVAGIGVTVMILTQALGILLEEVIVKLRLFPGCDMLEVRQDFDAAETIEIDAYDQYKQLYILLAQLGEHDDSQGHLKRAAAQFFLTNNTLISFLAGLIVSLILAIFGIVSGTGIYIYMAGLILCLIISFKVGAIRFRVMAKSIWAAHIAREKNALKESID